MSDVIKAFDEVKAATGDLTEAVKQLRESKERQLADLPTADSLMEKMAPELKQLIDEAIDAKAPRPAVDDAVKDSPFANSGEFYRSIYKREVPAEWASVNKAQSTSATAGGFLAPDGFRAEVLEIAMESALVRPRAKVIPMGTDTINIPAWNQASHASNFYGGVLAYWTSEGNAITDSSAAFLNVGLAVSELAALNYVSDKLFKASPLAVGQYLSSAFGKALTFQEEEAFFTGNGSDKPTGFIGSPPEVEVSRSGGASTIVAADIIAMYAAFMGDLSNAVWIANKTTFPQLYAMKDGGNNQLWIPSMVPGIPGTLFGIPVVWSEHASALGTKGDLSLCDFNYYLIGDLGTMSVDYSEHYRFANVQGAMRLVEYVDGKPWMASTYTPHKGTALSPFVVLK
jgi:HK97 family phage major capsid protein